MNCLNTCFLCTNMKYFSHSYNDTDNLYLINISKINLYKFSNFTIKKKGVRIGIQPWIFNNQ